MYTDARTQSMGMLPTMTRACASLTNIDWQPEAKMRYIDPMGDATATTLRMSSTYGTPFAARDRHGCCFCCTGMDGRLQLDVDTDENEEEDDMVSLTIVASNFFY